MRVISKYMTLGVGHGINDCVAGFVIGSLFYHRYPPLQLGIYTLLYNILAFGGQLPMAWLLETFFRPKRYLVTAFILLTFSLLFVQVIPELAVLFSGVASALFHVTGGTEAVREDDRSFGIGIFASPGIVGLVIGGWLAYIHSNFLPIGVGLCMGFLLMLVAFYKSSAVAVNTNRQQTEIERHDIIMCVLLIVISLRSFIWDVVQLIENRDFVRLIIIAVAAMCGKVSGGFVADKIGYKKYALYALLLSVPFLTFFKKNIAALGIGVFLLQSTIPATTIMILRQVQRKPAVAISFSFGLSVFIAITLLYTPLINYLNNNISVFGILLISILLLLWYGRTFSSQKTR